MSSSFYCVIASHALVLRLYGLDTPFAKNRSGLLNQQVRNDMVIICFIIIKWIH